MQQTTPTYELNFGDIAGCNPQLERLIEVVSLAIGQVTPQYLNRWGIGIPEGVPHPVGDIIRGIHEKFRIPQPPGGRARAPWARKEDRTLCLEPLTLEERASSRLEYLERRRQDNLERVVSAAAEDLLRENAELPAQLPDETWLLRCVQAAQDICGKDMQEIWGRMLAGEIRQPGFHSLRTLEFIRNLSPGQLAILERAGKVGLGLRNGTSIIPIHDKTFLANKRGLAEADYNLLTEMGVLLPKSQFFEAFKDPTEDREYLMGDGHMLIIRRGGVTQPVLLPIWQFTRLGHELLFLIDQNLDEEYYERIGKFFLRAKAEPTIAKIKTRFANGSMSYDFIREIK